MAGEDLMDELESGADVSQSRREAASKNVKGLTTNPKTRPKVIMVAVGLSFMAVIAFLVVNGKGKKDDLSQASITTPALNSQGVGLNDKTSLAYQELEREENRRKAEEAERRGGVHIELPAAHAQQEVPEQRVLEPQPVNQVQYQGYQSGYQQVGYVRDQSMDAGMKSQWQSMTAAWVSNGGTSKVIKDNAVVPATGAGNMNGGPINLANQAVATQPVAQGVMGNSEPEDPNAKYIRLRAGTVYMAVTKFESNSDDANTDTIATITNGPLRNATVIGNFAKANSANAKTLSLKFTTLSPVWDADAITINGLAIDADTYQKGMATSVDNHYWLRYGLPLAAGFIQGIGEAAARSASVINSSGLGSTTAFGELDFGDQMLVGAGRAGQVVSSDLQRRAQVQPTVKIASGTPIAIVFMSDVRVKVPESEAAKLKLP
ncbi:DotG/IcmE/VirB10 family protein [Methylobacillus sp. Pita2]|uniref:DotG/IcmE/VirB10 family protein n=1 Tax=Methylobacillus sp. Pita2 TaxID=3383245 RepID=UPI0038B59673